MASYSVEMTDGSKCYWVKWPSNALYKYCHTFKQRSTGAFCRPSIWGSIVSLMSMALWSRLALSVNAMSENDICAQVWLCTRLFFGFLVKKSLGWFKLQLTRIELHRFISTGHGGSRIESSAFNSDSTSSNLKVTVQWHWRSPSFINVIDSQPLGQMNFCAFIRRI